MNLLLNTMRVCFLELSRFGTNWMKRPLSPTEPQQYTKFIKTDISFNGFTCVLTPSCSQLSFSSAGMLDLHRESHHNHVCSECGLLIRFSKRMMDVHLDESHSSFFRVTSGLKVLGIITRVFSTFAL